MLNTIPYYRIPRDEDGKPSRNFDRVFTLALRWWPELDDPAQELAGATHLKRLRNGEDLSEHHLNLGIAYLYGSLAYYESEPNEPYPGRNDEAVKNLRDLLAEIEEP